MEQREYMDKARAWVRAITAIILTLCPKMLSLAKFLCGIRGWDMVCDELANVLYVLLFAVPSSAFV